MQRDTKKIRKGLIHFYDSVAESFSQTRMHWWYGFDFMKPYIRNMRSVLDFGCGNGRLIDFLKSSTESSLSDMLPEIYRGVDVSAGLIERARKRYPEYNFQLINRETNLPFDQKSVDLACAIAVFHHFTPEMATDALCELKRVLKENGRLIVTVWYLWNQKYLPFLGQGVDSQSPAKDGMVPFTSLQGQSMRYCYWWSLPDLELAIEAAGFSVIKSGYTYSKQGEKKNIFIVAEKTSEKKV